MTDVLVYKARLAEQLEMYKEMKETMKQLVETKHADPSSNKADLLTEDERNLLSVAYKNVVGQRRSSWRIVCSLEGKTEDQWRQHICQEFREQVENELRDLCNEIIALLENYLLPAEGDMPAAGSESTSVYETAVFFYKMKGDYLRYQVEISKDEQRDELSGKAKAAYQYADTVAKNLKSTHPIGLGLALNFSVYYYEIAGNPQAACALAKEAFDAAIAELDTASEDTYKDSTLILQLLRDNLSLWTTETEQEDQPRD